MLLCCRQPTIPHIKVFLVRTCYNISMLENTEGAITNGQSRETGNTGHTLRRKGEQNHNTICVGHYYTQTNTTNVNKTWTSYKQLEVKTNGTRYVKALGAVVFASYNQLTPVSGDFSQQRRNSVIYVLNPEVTYRTYVY